MYGFVFTVGQTVDRGDPLDQRESHWYRTFVGILRLMRPSKGIEAVSGHHDYVTFPLINAHSFGLCPHSNMSAPLIL